MTQAIALEDLDWQSDARTVLEKFARSGWRFDAYDLTETAELRNPPHPNCWGVLFRQAAADGVIREVGFHKSRRPGRSKGVCRVWQGTPAYRNAA